ncbi:hypothetical protein RHSIM_Rhsim13G0235700 [Rhododendron simsii]|uniref:Uncharacterized protein n=1 Tax=Rhododendron simsii TaxID=118357 RepID=A0A834G0N5_RHOSS|nr:hypothetical protein RHSIM_Rhsim13G0235700 [Rhododendron simsii]
MKHLSAASTYSNRNPVKFRIPTSDNLVPIRLDIEIDGQRFRDAFTWNPCGGCRGRVRIQTSIFSSQALRVGDDCNEKHTSSPFGDPDSEVVIFAKKTVKDLKLPPAFITQIAQSIQSQLTEFRSLEGQDMYTGEKIVTIKDLNNFESNPEEFARTFCADLGIEDPEVGPAVAVAIREQLYEIAIQSVASARETRINKKGRRGAEQFPARSSVIRKRREWDVYEPIVDLLSNEEVEALEAREERSART